MLFLPVLHRSRAQYGGEARFNLVQRSDRLLRFLSQIWTTPPGPRQPIFFLLNAPISFAALLITHPRLMGDMLHRPLFHIILLIQSVATQTCYFPDGSTNNYTPCPGISGTDPGPCCSPGDTCLQGSGAVGNCASEANGFLYRGACSDPSWAAADCAQSCWYDELGGT